MTTLDRSAINTPTDDEMGNSDSEQASPQMLTKDNFPSTLKVRGIFKLIEGKDGTTSFLPIKSKTGGKTNYIKIREAMCLSEKQANYVYKKVEEGKIINVNTLKQELVQELDRQVEDWSIFTDQINYVHHNKRALHRLDLLPLDYQQHKELYCKLKEEESNSIDIDFGLNPDTLKTKYVDLYEDMYAEMIYTNRFDENCDLSTTCLGQTK